MSYWSAWTTSVKMVYESNLANSKNTAGNFPTLGWPGIVATGLGVVGVVTHTGKRPVLYRGLDDRILSAPHIATPMYVTSNWVPAGTTIQLPYGISVNYPKVWRSPIEKRNVVYNKPIYSVW